MAFIKAASSIFLAALVVFVKSVGPFQKIEEPKTETIQVTNFQIPDKFEVTGGTAKLNIKFQVLEDKTLQSKECWVMAQPEGWNQGDNRLDQNNFKGDSIVTKITEKLEAQDQSKDWFINTCSEDAGTASAMYFELVKDSNGGWVFSEDDERKLFEGTYKSRSSVV